MTKDDDKKIIFYSLDYTKSLPIRPGVKDREWLNVKTSGVYDDLTMNMACQSGWELLAPGDFTAEWKGNRETDSTLIHSSMKDAHLFHTGMGDGIFSIRTYYIVKTPPDYAILVTGAPNFFKDGAVQLSSVIESNWSHTSFTLNWKMTRPGTVKFKSGEPIGFITLIPHRQLDNYTFDIDTIYIDRDLYDRYENYEYSVDHSIDYYKEGISDVLTMEKTDGFHITDRKLAEPKIVYTDKDTEYNDPEVKEEPDETNV